MSSPSFRLLTSIRYDPRLLDADWNTRVNDGVPTPVMLLPYHRDRLVHAAQQHGWSLGTLSAQSLSAACEQAVKDSGADLTRNPAFKIRALLAQDGTLTVTADVLPTSSPRDLLVPSGDPSDIRTLHIDPEPTPSSLFTATKTTHRPHYNASRARIGLSPIPSPRDSHIDVLLHTPDGRITETSIRNVAFQRGGQWITPHTSSGCLPGVMRRYLIEQGTWVEAGDGELLVDGIGDGELVMTANGVEGCCTSRVVSPTV
ncbi:aminotransferase class IV-domain-containing protein [Cristinia sonorae]|uniref:Aminotransferase class IV-domain-containing protein n=1 Tax=Cristinia sonorae TaxID=1940300 RepID=A0A8K0UN61_9AGAR|nr:aminotransferase class IV-domain-containing protein [Cristinia sonorae]